jgi:hypothetical protein
MDAVETGWTDQQARGVNRTTWTGTATLPRLGSRVRIPSSAPKCQVRDVLLTIALWAPVRSAYYPALFLTELHPTTSRSQGSPRIRRRRFKLVV